MGVNFTPFPGVVTEKNMTKNARFMGYFVQKGSQIGIIFFTRGVGHTSNAADGQKDTK